MGYELTRFIHEVDEEFQCAICLGVLQDPMQTLCEHAFCKECITKSLATNNKNCPIDRRPIRSNDLKLPARYFLNLLNKLDMKCDFRSKGCQTVVKLENLQQHLNSCQFDPNYSGVVCDRGCNLKITRREYEYNDCMHHLLNRVSCLEDQISKMNEKMKNSLTVNASTDNVPATMWRINYNIFITIDQSNYILKGHQADGENWPFAQCNYSLTPENSSFKVKFLNNDVYFGLTCKECEVNSSGMLLGTNGSIFAQFTTNNEKNCDYDPETKLFRRSITSLDGICECGVTFPYDFDSNRDNNVEVYFSINNKVFARQVIKMPRDGLYPTLHLPKGSTSTATYLTN